MHLHILAVLLANVSLQWNIQNNYTAVYLHKEKIHSNGETTAVRSDTDNLKAQLKREIRVHTMTPLTE